MNGPQRCCKGHARPLKKMKLPPLMAKEIGERTANTKGGR
jgi:hypothetical protein